MGILTVDLFVTADGVYQAPGGADEDPSGGFGYGGWQAPYADRESGEVIMAGIDRFDALLLGRRTYDIFAGYWPQRDDNRIGAKLNSAPKFVASRTLTDPSWAGTTVLRDPAAEVPALKQRFAETHVIGSGDLTRTLLGAGLVDRLNLYVYPVALGTGKRLFDGAAPTGFRLAEAPVGFPGGCVLLAYQPVGTPVTGIDMED